MTAQQQQAVLQEETFQMLILPALTPIAAAPVHIRHRVDRVVTSIVSFIVSNEFAGLQMLSFQS